MQAQDITTTIDMPTDTPEKAVLRVMQFFETLRPQEVARVKDFYCADALFKDPFNEVQGIDAIAAIFSHMFDALIQPRFVITQQVQQGEHCFVTWNFLFAMRKFEPNITQTIRGASHLVFRLEDGVWRVAVHRDYWDAAEELYEKLPMVGALMRWLKKRANS
jgi:ketosteroid isomerase-like protein